MTVLALTPASYAFIANRPKTKLRICAATEQAPLNWIAILPTQWR